MPSLASVALIASAVGLAMAGTSPNNAWPRQPGHAGNCKEFAWVNSGDTCYGIAAANGISLENFMAWNTGVGGDCSAMWANTYACVKV